MRSDREQVQVPAAFEGPATLGRGRVRDLSTTGARIEDIQTRPRVGTPLTVEFYPFPDMTPVKLHARVVRETESGGFAVEFEAPDETTRSLIQLLLISHNVLSAAE